MSISTEYNEALHFVIHNWYLRHSSPKHFRLVRSALADMRAAVQLGHTP